MDRVAEGLIRDDHMSDSPLRARPHAQHFMDRVAEGCDRRFERLRAEPGGERLCGAGSVMAGPAMAGSAGPEAVGLSVGSADGAAAGAAARQDLEQVRRP